MPLPREIVDAYMPRAAFIQIDMQRRHVDPNVGYHLVDAAKSSAIVESSQKILAAVRAANRPLVHVATHFAS